MTFADHVTGTRYAIAGMQKVFRHEPTAGTVGAHLGALRDKLENAGYWQRHATSMLDAGSLDLRAPSLALDDAMAGALRRLDRVLTSRPRPDAPMPDLFAARELLRSDLERLATLADNIPAGRMVDPAKVF